MTVDRAPSAAGKDSNGSDADEKAHGKSGPDVSAKGIVKLAGKQQIRLFHTPSREPFVTFSRGNHLENYLVKSAAFKEWLSAICYHQASFVPTERTLAEAINALAGEAVFGCQEKQVSVRLAECDGATYLDLGNDSWQSVKITAEGWEIVPYAPVKFIRSKGMLALPCPKTGGTINDLRSFVNLTDEDHWKLLVSWLVGALQPRGPFPLLILEGSHGSAKSTCSKMLLSLIDPNKAPIRATPSSERDLAISANNSWCIGYDNLSSVKLWLSDAFCRLASGGGFATRKLYTNSEEEVFEGMRPLLLNGIEIGIDRPDLLDRCIVLSLAPITEDTRETEAKLWARFEAARPYILGSLLDGLVCALRRLPEIELARKPRMADFATWVHAAEPAFGWPEGAFLKAYRRNRQDANILALEASPLAQAIRCIADGGWEGTATELSGELKKVQLNATPADEVRPIPNDPRELSQELRRLTPNLASVGITVNFTRTAGDDSKRLITIRRSGDGVWNDATDTQMAGPMTGE